MTSSLVGSEMCIRDRSRAMMNREGEAHLQLQQSIEAVATALIRVTCVTAVSYTHLTLPTICSV
eukprot:6363722-Prorocentrum_lima.AAC.1